MKNGIIPIRTALISVSDKRGVVALASFLAGEFNVKILSTGGTAHAIREANVPVIDVSDYTGFPECFDGRVKTLHPRIHGGLLYVRSNPEHKKRAEELKIDPIDLVVVNLYPFEKTAAKPKVTDAEVIENIDIGGPSMLRSAAKNHDSVAAVCNPDRYSWIQNQMVQYGGTALGTRRVLAKEVFEHTGRYDNAIAMYFANSSYTGPV